MSGSFMLVTNNKNNHEKGRKSRLILPNPEKGFQGGFIMGHLIL